MEKTYTQICTGYLRHYHSRTACIHILSYANTHTRSHTRLMEGRVEILPEQLLPPRPLQLLSCPQHIYLGCLATQLVARKPECTIHHVMQLQQCRNRLQVRVEVCLLFFFLFLTQIFYLFQSPRLSNSLCQVPPWVFKFYDTVSRVISLSSACSASFIAHGLHMFRSGLPQREVDGGTADEDICF